MRTPLERWAVEEALTELRSDGYEVADSLDQLSEVSASVRKHLSRYAFDFAGSKDGRLIVGQVLKRGESSEQEIRSLANDVDKLDGVELRLRWIGRVEGSAPAADRLLELAGQGFDLAKTNPEAALLVSYASLEGALELLGSMHGAEVFSQAVGSAQSLYSRGIISRTLYERVRNVSEIRSALVHMPPRSANDSDPSRIGMLTNYIATVAWMIAEGSFRTVDKNVAALLEVFAKQDLSILASWPEKEPDGALAKEIYRAVPHLDSQELAELAQIALDASGDAKA